MRRWGPHVAPCRSAPDPVIFVSVTEHFLNLHKFYWFMRNYRFYLLWSPRSWDTIQNPWPYKDSDGWFLTYCAACSVWSSPSCAFAGTSACRRDGAQVTHVNSCRQTWSHIPVTHWCVCVCWSHLTVLTACTSWCERSAASYLCSGSTAEPGPRVDKTTGGLCRLGSCRKRVS